jgi:predicted DNA-binding transcriptional regulator AlpA
MFPAHREISPNTVGWIEDELNEWIRSRAARRGGFPVDHGAHGIQE